MGKLRLKNRMGVAPHGTKLIKEGLPTDDYVEYWVEKIKGGASVVIMSPGTVDPQAAFPQSTQLHLWRRELVPYLSRVTEVARDHDCRVVFQLMQSAHHGLAPSTVPYTGETNSQAVAMTEVEIKRMHENYAVCAEVMVEAGFDGVELHGHGDLFTDFLSPAINRREDQYGGSIENRLRYVFESIDAIRARIGDESVIGLRHLALDGLPGSVDLDEGVRLAVRLADRLDYLNVEMLRERQFLSEIVGPMYVPPGFQRYAVAAVKRAVAEVAPEVPVFCVGRITTPQLAEEILAAGEADVVTMARALIADPELPNKVAEGRVEDIRPCLGDNQECWARASGHFTCTVNPAAGFERTLGIGTLVPAERSRSVVVVGGGPAGMEAARIVALRGHEVTLFERADRLGGQVLLARSLPGRDEIGGIVDWLPRQLEKAGVTVVLGTEVTKEQVLAGKPDAVIVATGSRWEKDGYNGHDYTTVDGWEDANVYSLTEALEDLSSISGNVVVYDQKGFVEGPGVAELLAAAGNQVTILNPMDSVLGAPLLAGTLQLDHVQRRLAAVGVSVLSQRQLRSIKGPSIFVENTVTRELCEIADVNAVVIVSGREPDATFLDLAPDLGEGGSAVEVHHVGDCARPDTIGAAITSAHRLARAL